VVRDRAAGREPAAAEEEGVMPRQNTIRASKLPSAKRCPASLATSDDVRALVPQPEVEATASYLELGNAVHAALAHLVDCDGDYDELDGALEDIAKAHNADLGDLCAMVSRVRRSGHGPVLGKPDLVEAEIPVKVKAGDLIITGTPDLVRWFGGFEFLEVLDWKSGWTAISGEEEPVARHFQILTYLAMKAKLAVAKGRPLKRLRATLFATRTGKPEIVEFTIEELDQLWNEVYQVAKLALEQYERGLLSRSFRFGEHCRRCFGRAICPVYRGEIRVALMSVADTPEIRIQDVPKTKKGEPNKVELARMQRQALAARMDTLVADEPDKAWTARRLSGQLHDLLDTAVKDYVNFFGEIALADGKLVRFREQDVAAPLSLDIVRAAVHKHALSITADPESADNFTDVVVDELEAKNRPRVARRVLGAYRAKE
jgi:hypothetical protein